MSARSGCRSRSVGFLRLLVVAAAGGGGCLSSARARSDCKSRSDGFLRLLPLLRRLILLLCVQWEAQFDWESRSVDFLPTGGIAAVGGGMCDR